MSEHDPTYGGLLLPDADLALMESTVTAGRTFEANIAQRDEWRAIVASNHREFSRLHPENMTTTSVLLLRAAFLALCRVHVATLDRLHRAELDGVQQRIERLKDKGLAE